MHDIKIKRALRLARIGNCPGSASDMLHSIPMATIAKLNSRELAELIDAQWALCGATKAIAARDAIMEGAIWDDRRERFIELAH